MSTDLALLTLQGLVLWKVQIPRRTKALLFCIFSFRLT